MFVVGGLKKGDEVGGLGVMVKEELFEKVVKV